MYKRVYLIQNSCAHIDKHLSIVYMSFHSILATYLKHLFIVFLIKNDDEFKNMYGVYITDEIPLLRFTPQIYTFCMWMQTLYPILSLSFLYYFLCFFNSLRYYVYVDTQWIQYVVAFCSILFW